MSKKIQIVLDFEEELDLYIKKNYPEAQEYRVLGESMDARGAQRGKRPKVNYKVEIKAQDEEFEQFREEFVNLGPLKTPPLIIGAGPAGLFCALRLLEYGVPSIIFERGESASKRMHAIARFWRYGIFNEESNVCFGEGGAGLFSDGKLITRVKSPHINYVMKKLVSFGAPEEITYTSNPHLGSNKIRKLITKISAFLKAGGCQIHYSTKVDKFLFEGNNVVGVEDQTGRKYFSQRVILATGHSAHNIYSELEKCGVSLKEKDFALGVRVEHPRRYINELQYGNFSESASLDTARYRLSYHDKTCDRGSYSFCMCPGGYVLSSGTEVDGIVSNGMSNFSRHSPWSNAAFVVTVKSQQDFKGPVLSGLNFQRKIEKSAFEISKEYCSGKEMPAQKMTDFLSSKKSSNLEKSSCPSGLFSYELDKLLPSFIVEQLKKSFEKFDKSMKGFITSSAQLIAPETRTSSPITILRDRQSLESESHPGLYPCGEGAGYAGGITSAAIDGVNVAMKILEKEKDYKYNINT